MRRLTVLVLSLAAVLAGCIDPGVEESAGEEAEQDIVTSSVGVTTRGEDADLPPAGVLLGEAAEIETFPLVTVRPGEVYNETFLFAPQDSVALVLALVNLADEPTRVRAVMISPGPPEPEPLTAEQTLVLPPGGGGAVRLLIAAPDLPGQSERLEPAVLIDSGGPVQVSGTFYVGIPGAV